MMKIATTSLPAVGAPLLGGFYAGRYFLGQEERALIVSPPAFATRTALIGRSGPRHNIKAAMCDLDGYGNTKALAEAGSAIAAHTLSAIINGYSGWHIPSRFELLVMQINLLQLADFGRHGPHGFVDPVPKDEQGNPVTSFPMASELWSSTQKAAGSAWSLHMLPLAVPRTNWTNKAKTIRPVMAIPIGQDGDASKSPSEATASIVQRAELATLRSVLERFINEDLGRFYGRTADLEAQLMGAIKCA